MVSSYNFNNNNIFMSKDSEEDPGEDIDVGDEQSRDEPGDDVRCNDCHDSFPNLPSFLKHREACSGQDTAATGASLQRESGLKNTFLKKIFNFISIQYVQVFPRRPPTLFHVF